jgi:hypothetical protein
MHNCTCVLGNTGAVMHWENQLNHRHKQSKYL